MASRIGVVGLRELRRGLKNAEGRSPKELQQTNKAVAEMLVPEIRARLAGHSPRAGSRAIGTIRALASATRAQIAGGSEAVPWYGGHEWGGFGNIRGNSRKGNPGHTRMFPPRNKGGYAIYPTIAANRERMIERYAQMLTELTSEAFPG